MKILNILNIDLTRSPTPLKYIAAVSIMVWLPCAKWPGIPLHLPRKLPRKDKNPSLAHSYGHRCNLYIAPLEP